jgi:hypothetical protein
MVTRLPGQLPVVTLYGRPGCTLCLEAEQELRRLARSLAFALNVVDIEQDDALLERFMFEIPVVTLDGEELARAPIRKGALERRLREALG